MTILTQTIDTNQLPEEIRDDLIDLFHTEDLTSYALVRKGERTETLSIRSDEMRRFVAGAAFKKKQDFINKDLLQKIIDGLDAIACYQGSKQQVHVRVASTEDGLEIDLNNNEGECISVTSSGWKIAKPTVNFNRPRAMQELPRPKEGGDFELFKEHFNTDSEDELKLLVSAMCYFFRPSGPYSIIALKGPEGSCKSTCTRMIKRLVDPSISEDRAPPGSERDLFVSAKYDHLVCLDNLSNINAKFSDGLCRLATGATYGRKKNYTDDDEHLMKRCNPIVINGITDLARMPDLVSRTVMISLKPPEVLKDEKTLWQKFQTDAPYMIGFLMDGIVSALKYYSSIKLDSKLRLFDLAIWGTAAEKAWEWEPLTFLNILEENQSRSLINTLTMDLVANAIDGFLQDKRYWAGPAEEALEELGRYAGCQERSKAWPTTAHHLMQWINRLEKSLPKIGIEYIPHEKSGLSSRTKKVFILRKIEDQKQKPSLKLVTPKFYDFDDEEGWSLPS